MINYILAFYLRHQVLLKLPVYNVHLPNSFPYLFLMWGGEVRTRQLNTAKTRK